MEPRETEQIVIDVPKSIYTRGVDKTYIEEALAAVLYHKGILTLKEAHELIGQTRREFEEITLPKFGYTPGDEDTEIELKASQWE